MALINANGNIEFKNTNGDKIIIDPRNGSITATDAQNNRIIASLDSQSIGNDYFKFTRNADGTIDFKLGNGSISGSIIVANKPGGGVQVDSFTGSFSPEIKGVGLENTITLVRDSATNNFIGTVDSGLNLHFYKFSWSGFPKTFDPSKIEGPDILGSGIAQFGVRYINEGNTKLKNAIDAIDSNISPQSFVDPSLLRNARDLASSLFPYTQVADNSGNIIDPDAVIREAFANAIKLETAGLNESFVAKSDGNGGVLLIGNNGSQININQDFSGSKLTTNPAGNSLGYVIN